MRVLGGPQLPRFFCHQQMVVSVLEVPGCSKNRDCHVMQTSLVFSSSRSGSKLLVHKSGRNAMVIKATLRELC